MLLLVHLWCFERMLQLQVCVAGSDVHTRFGHMPLVQKGTGLAEKSATRVAKKASQYFPISINTSLASDTCQPAQETGTQTEANLSKRCTVLTVFEV